MTNMGRVLGLVLLLDGPPCLSWASLASSWFSLYHKPPQKKELMMIKINFIIFFLYIKEAKTIIIIESKEYKRSVISIY